MSKRCVGIFALIFGMPVSALSQTASSTGSESSANSAPEEQTAQETTEGTEPNRSPAVMEAESNADAGNRYCDDVVCSNRGKCIVVNDAPTCACEAGFVADAVNGLSCLPEQGTASNDVYDLSVALNRLDIDAHKVRYDKKRAAGQFDGSFIEYLERQMKRYRGLALMTAGIGLAVAGSSVPLILFGSRVGGILDAIAGTVVFIGGVTSAVANHRRLKILRQYDADHKAVMLHFDSVTPFILSNRGANGAALRFVF